MKLSTSITLDESRESLALLPKLKAMGFDALHARNLSGSPSKVLIQGMRDAGLQAVLLLRQGSEDAPEYGSTVSAQDRAAQVWDSYVKAGYQPSDVLGLSLRDEPTIKPGDFLNTLADKQVWAENLCASLYDYEQAWRILIFQCFTKAPFYIWFNANTPSGRIYSRQDGPVCAADFWRAECPTWSMEGWSGDIGSQIMLAAWSGIWRTMNRPGIFYAIGQMAHSGFADLLARAELSGVQLCHIYHFGPTFLQGSTVQNADAYAPANVQAVHAGIKQYHTWLATTKAQQLNNPITLLWPFHEDNEINADELRCIKNHPAEADWDYVIDAWMTAAVCELNGRPVVWTKAPAKAALSFDPAGAYPISQMSGPAGPWKLNNPPVKGLYERRPGVAWNVALNNAAGVSLTELRTDPDVQAIEQAILAQLPTPAPIQQPPPPASTPLDPFETFSAAMLKAVIGLKAAIGK